MATTYSRIYTALGEMKTQKEWDHDQLVGELTKNDSHRSQPRFHILPKGAKSRQPLSDRAFMRLFELMLTLKLIRRGTGEKLEILKATSESLDDEDKFCALISRRVMETLSSRGAPIGEIKRATNSIQLPDVSDPSTILLKLGENNQQVNLGSKEFAQLLFLLACAGKQALRHMRIFYEFE